MTTAMPRYRRMSPIVMRYETPILLTIVNMFKLVHFKNEQCACIEYLKLGDSAHRMGGFHMKAVKITGYILFGLIEVFFLFGVFNSDSKAPFIVLMFLVAALFYCITKVIRKLSRKETRSKNAIPAPRQEPITHPVQTERRTVTKEDIQRLFQEVDIRVAGVTYNNGNGNRSRQTILRKIAKKQPPYEYGADIAFKITEFNGEPAVEIWADGEQVGYVQREKLRTFLKWAKQPYYIYDYEVYGGGKAADGSALNYGMRIRVNFLREGEVCDYMKLNPPML